MNNVIKYDEFVNEEFTFNFPTITDEKIKKMKEMILEKFPIVDPKSEHGSEQRKKVVETIGTISENVMNIWLSSLQKVEKFKKIQTYLKGITWVNLIIGIGGLIFNTHFHWLSAPELGGMTWLGIALVVFIIRMIHKVVFYKNIITNDIMKLWNITKKEVSNGEPKNEKLMTFELFLNEELRPETYISAADKLEQKGHTKRSDKLREYVKELAKNIEPITVEVYGKTCVLGADNIIIHDNSKTPWIIVEVWFDLSTNIEPTDDTIDEYDPWVMYLNFEKGTFELNIDGILIDRKTAVKVLRLLKEVSKTLENKELADAIMKLTVNDLYED